MSPKVRDASVDRGSRQVDIDLAGVDSPRRVREIEHLLAQRNGLLVFRNQSLDEQQQHDLSGRFGATTPDPDVVAHGDLPSIDTPSSSPLHRGENSLYWTDGPEFGKREPLEIRWHSDLAYLQNPLCYSFLYAVDVEAGCAPTLVADLTAAWDALPAVEKSRLESMRVIHHWHRAPDLPAVSRPASARHPITDRMALAPVDDAVFFRGFEGLSAHESRELRKRIVTHATRDLFVYEHAWKQGDLLLWDNRYTLHRRGSSSDPGAVRVLRRTQAKKQFG